MPVEQPTKFELVLNTRTAKAIGINLSQSLLVRADEVFDYAAGQCRLLADFVAEVGDYCARGLPRFVDTSSYYAAFWRAVARRPEI